MNNKIRCAECEWMEIYRPMYSGVGLCRECYCKHPNVSEVYAGRGATGYIAHTEMDGRTIRVKTCPRWCPRKKRD